MAKSNKMIESSGSVYEMTKVFLGFFTYFFLPLSILFFVYFSFENPIFIFGIFLLMGFNYLFYYLQKKSKTNFYNVRMNDKKIFCKRDGQKEIEITWDEVIKIKRVLFFTPPLYYLKAKNIEKLIVFPTSSYFSYVSIFTGWFLIIWDFSKMGKHIRKMKEAKNLN